MNGYLFSVSIR